MDKKTDNAKKEIADKAGKLAGVSGILAPAAALCGAAIGWIIKSKFGKKR